MNNASNMLVEKNNAENANKLEGLGFYLPLAETNLDYAASVDMTVLDKVPSLKIEGISDQGCAVELMYVVDTKKATAASRADQAQAIVRTLSVMLPRHGVQLSSDFFDKNFEIVKRRLAYHADRRGQMFSSDKPRFATIELPNCVTLDMYHSATPHGDHFFNPKIGGIKGTFVCNGVTGAWVLHSSVVKLSTAKYSKKLLIDQVTKLFEETFPTLKGQIDFGESLLPAGYPLKAALSNKHKEKSFRKPRQVAEVAESPVTEDK